MNHRAVIIIGTVEVVTWLALTVVRYVRRPLPLRDLLQLIVSIIGLLSAGRYLHIEWYSPLLALTLSMLVIFTWPLSRRPPPKQQARIYLGVVFTGLASGRIFDPSRMISAQEYAHAFAMFTALELMGLLLLGFCIFTDRSIVE